MLWIVLTETEQEKTINKYQLDFALYVDVYIWGVHATERMSYFLKILLEVDIPWPWFQFGKFRGLQRYLALITEGDNDSSWSPTASNPHPQDPQPPAGDKYLVSLSPSSGRSRDVMSLEAKLWSVGLIL